MSSAIVAAEFIGTKFARLTVRCKAGSNKHRKIEWWCDCECGGETKTTATSLKRGNTKSCGCLRDEITGARRRTHALSKSPEYRNWCAMKERCYSPSHKNYNLYGERGITVCERWKDSFENFYEDMGPRPFPRATVERKDTDGHYSPDNCVWETQKEQCRNKRNNHLLTVDGETLPISVWAERFKIDQRTIWARINLGWQPVDAIMLPRQHRFSGPNSKLMQSK